MVVTTGIRVTLLGRRSSVGLRRQRSSGRRRRWDLFIVGGLEFIQTVYYDESSLG